MDPLSSPKAAGPEEAEPLARLAGVTKSLGGKEIIKKASLSLWGGRALALTGPSGVGKTTLLEILAGLTRPDSGGVFLKTEAALMFQDDAQVPWLTARDNLLFVAPEGIDRSEAVENALKWLDAFELPAGVYPGAMSGGMRRRLNLARVLYAGRPILILDEPLAFLDESWRERVAERVAAAARGGAAVALSDHGDLGALSERLGEALTVAKLSGPPVELVL
jgi:ABC-type nitrate/sulfonate/bicarbonate transport system ATPase subunit